MRSILRTLALSTLAIGASGSYAATLYSNDFETNANGFSFGGSLQSTQGYSSFGFGSQMLYNDSVSNITGTPTSQVTQLTLNLPAAASNVVLSFSLAVIDSWDNGNFCCGPDRFEVSRGQGIPQSVFSAVFDNYLNGGATVAPGLTSLTYGSNLGFSGSFSDAAYTVTVNLGSVSAGPLYLNFYATGPGWQGGSDESWAIDNVVLTGDIAAVPEPRVYALMLAGLAALAWRRRGTYKR